MQDLIRQQFHTFSQPRLQIRVFFEFFQLNAENKVKKYPAESTGSKYLNILSNLLLESIDLLNLCVFKYNYAPQRGLQRPSLFRMSKHGVTKERMWRYEGLVVSKHRYKIVIQ